MELKTTLSLFLMALMVSGVAFGYFGGVNAESIPKPSVPEFSVQVIDLSYIIPYRNVLVVIAGLLVFVVVYLRKRSQN